MGGGGTMIDGQGSMLLIPYTYSMICSHLSTGGACVYGLAAGIEDGMPGKVG